MKKNSIKQIVILICITSLLVLGTQVYRTAINYQANKQRLINDVQFALDLGIEKYYADKARNNVLVMGMNKGDSMAISTLDNLPRWVNKGGMDSIIGLSKSTMTHMQFISIAATDHNSTATDSLQTLSAAVNSANNAAFTLLHGDSLIGNRLPVKNFQKLQKKVMISISEDLLRLGEVWKLVQEELTRKGLNINFQLAHRSATGKTTSMGTREAHWKMSTPAKSTYLKSNEELMMYFENASLIILKKGLFDLVISFGVLLTVIGALLYLYRIISEQKQVALIKDDLISNITHEFKTPIATISSAIEGISSFNEANDQEKTKRYLAISAGQLKKLNTMVEKLLETATIDSGKIEINREETDLKALTNRVVANHHLLHPEPAVKLSLPEHDCWASIDPFHLENALSNLVDNAIKYGGDRIELSLRLLSGNPCWQVVDNGGAIEKAHQERIFDKLYRIPKGNQHDVKGFGIGLYYTKEVVEKHGGQISLEVKKGYTCFTIKL